MSIHLVAPSIAPISPLSNHAFSSTAQRLRMAPMKRWAGHLPRSASAYSCTDLQVDLYPLTPAREIVRKISLHKPSRIRVRVQSIDFQFQVLRYPLPCFQLTLPSRFGHPSSLNHVTSRPSEFHWVSVSGAGVFPQAGIHCLWPLTNPRTSNGKSQSEDVILPTTSTESWMGQPFMKEVL
jgi:hypothetical protein